MPTHLAAIMTLLLLVAVVVLFYSAAYLCLMEQAFVYSGSEDRRTGESKSWATPYPVYLVGHRWAYHLFGPAHYVDQKLRPHAWCSVGSAVPGHPKPFQFGLLALFGAMTVAAITLAHQHAPLLFLGWTTALAFGLPAVAFTIVLLYKATKHGRD